MTSKLQCTVTRTGIFQSKHQIIKFVRVKLHSFYKTVPFQLCLLTICKWLTWGKYNQRRKISVRTKGAHSYLRPDEIHRTPRSRNTTQTWHRTQWNCDERSPLYKTTQHGLKIGFWQGVGFHGNVKSGVLQVLLNGRLFTWKYEMGVSRWSYNGEVVFTVLHGNINFGVSMLLVFTVLHGNINFGVSMLLVRRVNQKRVCLHGNMKRVSTWS